MVKNGFTLIELLITICIVGLLMTIAYPSYSNYMYKAKRAEAYTVLIKLVNKQEMYYISQHVYATDLKKDLNLDADPFITENGYYSIKSTSKSEKEDFILTATAIGDQVNDTECKTLSITQDYIKSAKTISGEDNDKCWK